MPYVNLCKDGVAKVVEGKKREQRKAERKPV